MGNQQMLVIIFMYLEAIAVQGFKEVEWVGDYSDWEGFIHQLGINVGMVLSGTRMW